MILSMVAGPQAAKPTSTEARAAASHGPGRADSAVQREREGAAAERRADEAGSWITGEIAATQLVADSTDDPKAADRRYRGQTLQVVGVVGQTGRDATGRPFVTIGSGAEDERLQVQCRLNAATAGTPG